MTEKSPAPEYPTLEDLLTIVEELGAQVRDLGMLASAVSRPRTTVFGEDAYPDLATKAAALMHSLGRNHALVDGNKRISWVATRLFLQLNGRDLIAAADDAFEVVMAVAAGKIDVAELAGWIAGHLQDPSTLQATAAKVGGWYQGSSAPSELITVPSSAVSVGPVPVMTRRKAGSPTASVSI